MFDVPGSDIRTVIVSDSVVTGKEPAKYIRSPDGVPAETEEEPGYEEEELKIHTI